MSEEECGIILEKVRSIKVKPDDARYDIGCIAFNGDLTEILWSGATGSNAADLNLSTLLPDDNTTNLILGRHDRAYVLSTAFHASLPLIVSGSNDKTAKLWSLSEGGAVATCVATLAGHSGWVNSVTFHPTKRFLATGSGDNTAKVWRMSADGTDATCVATLSGHTNSVRTVAFHPSMPLLATGSEDMTAKLWSLSPDGAVATCVATLDGHDRSVRCIGFHQ